MAPSEPLLISLLLALVACGSGDQAGIESSGSRASAASGADRATDITAESSELTIDPGDSPNAARANPRFRAQAPLETPNPEIAREAALQQARESGLLGKPPSDSSSTWREIGSGNAGEAPKLAIVKTLEAMGYDVSSGVGPGGQHVRFTATKAGRVVSVTYVPPSGDADALTAREKSRLNREARVFTSGNLFLAVESDDMSASQALLDAILGKR